MLKYDDIEVILDTAAWQTYKDRAANTVDADKLDDFLFKSIKEQLNCLRYYASAPWCVGVGGGGKWSMVMRATIKHNTHHTI